MRGRRGGSEGEMRGRRGRRGGSEGEMGGRRGGLISHCIMLTT